MAHLENMGNKKWRITIELGIDPKTGKRLRKYKTVNGTKKDAEKKKAEMIKKYSQGPIQINKDMKLKEWLIKWLKEKQSKVSYNTFKPYETYVIKHLIPGLGKYKLSDLEKYPYLISDYLEIKRESGKLSGPGGLSEQTLRHHYNILNNALGKAKGLGYIGTNPCQNEAIEKPIPNPDDVNPYTEEEIPKLLSLFEGKWMFPIVFLDIFTGMRRGEAAGLFWYNANLPKAKIYVRKSAYRVKNKGIEYKKPKTKSSIRAIDLSQNVIQLLKEHRKKQLKQAEYINIDNNLVFPMPDGGNTDPDYITKKFKIIIKGTEFDGHTFHDLRHTHASLLLKKGATMKAVQERLGHASIQVTIDRYSHLVPTIQKETAKMLDEIEISIKPK
ncbi:MAG: site-specific integrase [Halanaerobiales bacterium]|nr:site-specific integrase [Halanaerobiales bacterium]